MGYFCCDCPAYSCAECPRAGPSPGLTDRELTSRRNRWKRRYPTLRDYLAAHQGEAVGIVHLNGSTVRYYWTRRKQGLAYHCTVGGKPIKGQEVSRAEFCHKRGLDITPHVGPLPVWPPTPEVWGRRNGKKAKPVNGNGKPSLELLQRYADYGATVRGVGLTPIAFEPWLERLNTTRQRQGQEPLA